MSAVDSPEPFRSRRRIGLIAAVAAVALVVLAGTLSKPPATRTNRPADRAEGPTAAEDPLATARDALKDAPTLDSAQTAVKALNTHVNRAGADPVPPSEAAMTLLRDELKLDAGELAEVTRGEFGPLDAHYIEAAALFRDAAESLGAKGLPDDARAAAGFAWACRHVWLTDRAVLPAPPQFVLGRGFGTLAERTAAALAVLWQMGFDPCLVGTERANWAVGVPVKGDVLLFDPRTGGPFAGPGGKGVATLAQVRAEPALAAGVPAESVKAAELRLVGHLSALAPRMRLLEAALKSTPAAMRLTADPVALREAYRKLTAGGPLRGVPVVFWNPPNFSTWRLLRDFTPAADGGTDSPNQSGLLRRDEFYAAAIPSGGLPPAVEMVLREVGGDPARRVQNRYLQPVFAFVGLEGATPRALLVRGQFEEASLLIQRVLDESRRARERARLFPELPSAVKQWVEELKPIYLQLINATQAARAGRPEAVEVQAVAQSAYDAMWKERAAPLYALIDAAAGEWVEAESTYLLALGKLDQAEALALAARRPGASDADREAAKSAAATALVWWGSYQSKHANAPATPASRREEAKRLQERSVKLRDGGA